MSIHSILTMPRHPEQASTPEVNPRLNAHQGDGNSCWSTTLKVMGVIGGILASIAGFVFLGPIGGIIVTLLSGGAALLLFNNCCGSSAHDHPGDAAIPWYQRVFSFSPTGTSPDPQPHVRVGGGHIPAGAAARPWYENWFPFMHSGVRHMDGGGRGANVRVGGGHGRGAPAPGGAPGGPGGAPHVPPGGGHMGGHPVPGVAGAHVPVGRGHIHGHGGRGGLLPLSGAHVPVGRGG